MNNYSNMGGFMMNEFPINYMQNMPGQNEIFPQATPASVNDDKQLTKRLSKQAGDNMNFNKCDFNGKTTPNNLYDVYNGFIRGNMFPDLYNQYKLTRPYDVKPMNQQAELLTKVDAYSFAAHDLNLYLDTHPNDQEMIELFKEYVQDKERSIKEYETKFGPLFVDDSMTYPWAWNDLPWPWEN